MDSRLDVFAALGLGDGEAHVLRNAGGVITDDVIRSLALSQRKLGTREVMLIHHTDCGLEKVSDDGFRAELQEATGVAPAFAIESFTDVDAAVRQSIRRVRRSTFLLHRDVVRGFVYDVDSHRLREIEVEPEAEATAAPVTDPGPRRSAPPRSPAAGRRLGAPALAADGAVWWSEGRPSEGGRVALMRRTAEGEAEEVTAPGGQRPHPGARVRRRRLGLAGDRVLYVDFADQRLYGQRPGERPVALTPEPEAPAALRYADLSLGCDGQRVFCVRERHGEGEPVNEIVAVPLDGGGEVAVLAGGHDFYSFPRPSPDGATLAWTCWDHPHMPWERTELWVAPLADPGAATPYRRRRGESVFQPEWDMDGQLHFVSDRDGWWNLYRVGAGGEVEQLSGEEAELGHPQWLFGGSTYAFLEGGAIACIRCERGAERLGVLEPGAERVRDLGLPVTSFGFPSLAAAGSRLAFAAASPEHETAVVVHDLAGGETELVRAAGDEPLDPAYAPVPRAIEFPTAAGEDRARLLLPADQS